MRHSLHRLIAMAVGLACCTAHAATPATPSQQVEALRDVLGRSVLDTPGVEMPDDRQALDEALARRDWAYLGEATRNVGTLQNAMKLLNWERYQIYRGSGYNVAYMYSSTLTTAANSYDKAAAQDPRLAPTARGFRQAALAQLLYTYAVLAVDGVRCADPTAPQAHRDQITGFTRDLRFSITQFLPQDRFSVLTAALKQEELLAPVRDPDPDLCRGGLDDLGEALESHPDRATTTGPQPGYPGTNVIVPIDPTRPPKYSDRAEWLTRQQKARAGLPDALGAIISLSHYN